VVSRCSGTPQFSSGVLSAHSGRDENVLRDEGMANFEAYAVKPGAPLILDLSVDEG
jgi:hypothetical protein